MSDIVRVHSGKQPRRPHFIPEWAELRGFSQADLAREIGADKSVVSRWYNGTSPGEEWQAKLAGALNTTRDGLFRHPDDDWIARFFKDREREEIDRIKRTLETAFPRKRA